ncbi:MAG: AMP-binding protein, partial [bacterium]
MLFDHARERPHELAIDDGTRTRTFAELVDRIALFAAFLQDEAGFVSGDHLSLLMGNRVEGIELLLGGIFAGQWVTPINWHLAEEEIEYVVQDSGSRLIVTDERYAPMAHRIAAATSGL